MSAIQHYSNTYGLPTSIVEHFLTLKPGEATRVINQIAGNDVAITKAELKKQLDIIQSEVKEGFDNLSDNTLDGLRDDAMDIVFTGYGLANRLGAPADLDYVDVVLSNLCKFDTNEADAERTRDKYLALGVVTQILSSEYGGQTYLVTKVAFDQLGNDGKKYPGGKWLKSYKWVDCAYQGKVLTPTVLPTFELNNLSLSERQTLKALLAKAAGSYQSEDVAIELEKMIRYGCSSEVAE